MRALFPAFMVVCALLVVAGAAKVSSPSATGVVSDVVRVRLPHAAVRLLGGAEVVIGAGAAVRPIPPTAVFVALAYGAFCAFLLLSRPVNCGCFGATAAGGGRAHALPDAVACSVAVLAAVAPPPGAASMIRQGPVVAVPLGLGIAAGTFAAYLVFTALPEAWRAYGAEGS
ncbi:MAG TPA: hypothetical protein VMA77_01845 [Solirubrobacteraceae bacterium]|nr:hypothetical protein [Solirubrobacteraceae bacterium]